MISHPSCAWLRSSTALTALLVLSSLLADVGAQVPEAVDLRPKFVTGRVTRYEIWSLRTRDVTVSFQGQSQTMESTLETKGEVTWRIDRVNADGSATCTMTLDWISATSKSAEIDQITVDSRKPSGDNELMHELVKAMAGAPITVEMAADGTVTRVRGVDAIHAKVTDPKNAPDELDFKETAAELVAITAAQEQMAMNRNWKTQADWNHELGKMHHDTTYTLTAIENVADIPVATVTGVSKLRLDLDQSKFPADGPKIDIKMTGGESTTQIMFDLSRREAVGRNSITQTEIEARITHNGQTVVRTMGETQQGQIIRIAEK